MKIEQRAGVMDIISIASQRDTILLLPTLNHAVEVGWWKVLGTAFSERHGEQWITQTRTNIVMRRTHTTLSLWVPYVREPTMPMDIPKRRRGRALITPYHRADFGGRLGE